MSEADDWESVTAPAAPAGGGDDWESVAAPEPVPQANEQMPDAFMGRMNAGALISRVTKAAAAGAQEGAGQGTPTGFEDATLAYLIEKGVFHDPATGRPGPLQLTNEAVMMPAAQLWQSVNRAVSGGLHGAGSALEQLVTEFGGSQGEAARARRDVISAGEWAMIEGGMGRFSRPSVDAGTVLDKTVGTIPAAQDFANAAKVLKPEEPAAAPVVEQNLRRMWQEEGIHPAEAVHDAEQDAFVKHDVTTMPVEIRPETEDWRTAPLSSLPDDVAKFLDDPNVLALPSGRLIRTDPHTGDRYRFTTGGVFKSSGEADLKMGSEKPLGSISDVQRHLQGNSAENVETIPESWNVKPEEMEQAFGEGASLSAAVTPPEEIPVDVQPPRPSGSLAATAQAAADRLFDVGHDIQMKLAPMATGSRDSMATVKDYMNAQRRNAWDAARIDTDLTKRFSAADRARMANAMEEESLSLRLEEPASAREHQGLATLEPEQRAYIDELNRRQQNAWLRARDLGMVEGDGIEMHYPRMVMGIPKGLDASAEGSMSLTAIGYDLRSKTPYLKQRKHVELEDTEKAIKEKVGMALAKQGKSVDEIKEAVDKVKVARDIRAVNIATKQLEDAIAGRTLIKNIQEVGKRTGDDTVAEGFQPDPTWFTVDHPSFKTWRPKLAQAEDGSVKAVTDAAGNPVFEQVPIYVRGDFEGPLRAAMWGKTGAAYSGLMALKGKTMGLIMYSPMVHNLVEFGRSVIAAPLEVGTLRVYFAGNRAKNDVGLMHEAIDSGLVPIGKRFFNQDINAVMEQPDLTPGRGWTAKIAAAVPGLFDEAAGTAVKQAVDKMGDFWHNTLLWDRIADLQAGLYVHFRDGLVAKGMDQPTAARIAAHWANRYAGALPKEAMSEAATKLANFVAFSRSFTFGNLGVMKDALTGLPKDVIAQIERDAGFKTGSIEGAEEAAQQAVTTAKSMARRKAMMVLGLDIAAMYVGNSVLQSAFNVLLGGDTLDEESHNYLRRFRDTMNEVKTHPLSLLQPMHLAESLSATGDNEPGKRDRIMIGQAKDGTAIYARNPVGKIGEEFTGYFSSPLDMMRKKEGTILRPLMQIFSNDAGFGRKIYDPQAEDWSRYAWNVGQIVKHLVASQLPMQAIGAAHDLVTGEGDKTVNWLQVAGPLAGVTFSRGAPGGPAVGEMYDNKSRREFAISKAMPDLRRQIQRGDLAGAQQAMEKLGMDGGYQRWVIKTSLDPRLRLSPRSVRDLYNSGTEEQKARFGRAMQRMQAQP